MYSRTAMLETTAPGAGGVAGAGRIYVLNAKISLVPSTGEQGGKVQNTH
jgi:hypothetical protein